MEKAPWVEWEGAGLKSDTATTFSPGRRRWPDRKQLDGPVASCQCQQKGRWRTGARKGPTTGSIRSGRRAKWQTREAGSDPRSGNEILRLMLESKCMKPCHGTHLRGATRSASRASSVAIPREATPYGDCVLHGIYTCTLYINGQ